VSEEKNPFSSLVTLSTLRLVLKALAMAFTSHRTLPTFSLLRKISLGSEREDGLWPKGKESWTYWLDTWTWKRNGSTLFNRFRK
jgi:hypothetical protein